MNETASATDKILSASASGISIANSSSIANTTSTMSKESKSNSSNFAFGDTFEESTYDIEVGIDWMEFILEIAMI